jgi:hypothetical protein
MRLTGTRVEPNDEGPAVAIFEVVYTDGRERERLAADSVEQQGRFFVLIATCVVVNRPREVVALRVPIAAVCRIREVDRGDADQRSSSSFQRGS